MHQIDQRLLPQTDFGDPPPGYIPGLGRGAVGFITRSDIGPANVNQEAPPPVAPGVVGPAARAPNTGSFNPLTANNTNAPHDANDTDNTDYSDFVYDQWNGYSQPLFARGDYDAEDREADEVYNKIEDKMDGRRRDRRQEKLKEEIRQFQKERPTISHQFADLKRNLSKMNYDDWNSIPDAQDFSIKQNQQEKYVPVPDSVIEGARREGQSINAINPNSVQGNQSMITSNSINSNSGTMSSMAGLNMLGEARGTILSIRLDKQTDSVQNTNSVDKSGYLTQLGNVPILSEADVGDFQQARLLMQNMISIDPKSSHGWIQAARIEEMDGKLQAARSIVSQGLAHCEESDDLWLEAARLETPDVSKAILAKAVSILPQSSQIWMAAAKQQADQLMRIKVLRKALEHVPNDADLWKMLIELESEEEARSLLYQAVECLPGNVEMWLALAQLETYENAKSVLNRARQVLPTEHSVWIYAAKLEESEGRDSDIVDKVINRGLATLRQNGYILNREEWMKEAQLCEKSMHFITCSAIIQGVVNQGVQNEEREKVFFQEATAYASSNFFVMARSIINYALDTLENKSEILTKAIEFQYKYENIIEKQSLLNLGQKPLQQPDSQGQDDKGQQKQQIEENNQEIKNDGGTETGMSLQMRYIQQLLERAVRDFPNDENFWISAASRFYFNAQNPGRAQGLLTRGLQVLPNSQKILLLYGKIEQKQQNLDSAKKFIEEARVLGQSVHSWYAAVQLEYQLGSFETAQSLAEQAVEIFPTFEKLWMLYAQIFQKVNLFQEAKGIYEKGIEKCQESVALWIAYVDFESKVNSYAQARPLLQKARLKHQKNAIIWSEAIRFQIQADNQKGAGFLISKALRECPQDGTLLSLSIELEPKATRKKIIVEALKSCPDDPYVNLSVAKLFWKEQKMQQARKWIENVITLHPSLGDAWGLLYLFEQDQKVPAVPAQILELCNEQRPQKGIIWREVKKSQGGWALSPAEVLLKVSIILNQQFAIIE